RVQGSEGTRFLNTGKCVSYAAHGGTLVAIPRTVSITYTPSSDPHFCNVTVNLSHFAPNTQYAVNTLATDVGITLSFGPFPVTTDSSGAGSVFVYSFVQRAGGTSSVNATVDGVSS